MRRIVVGLAAGLLLAVGDCVQPTGLRRHLHQGPQGQPFRSCDPGAIGRAGDGDGGRRQVRHDENYMAETSIKVVPTSWVGTVPTTLWVTGGGVDHPIHGPLRTFGASGPAPEAFRPGTQWVVQVRTADAWMTNHPLPVVGNTVRIPRGSPPQTTSTAVTPRSSTSTPYEAELTGGPHPPQPDIGHPLNPSTGAELRGCPHIPQPSVGYPLEPRPLVSPSSSQCSDRLHGRG